MCEKHFFEHSSLVFLLFLRRRRGRKKNVICSSVAAYITCAIELILMGVLVDTVEQMSDSVVTIFSNLYRAYSGASTVIQKHHLNKTWPNKSLWAL